jgi:hypothetical protein
MRHDTSSSGSIHPSIDGLAALIESSAKRTPEESAQLRELCRRKISSYREDIYLKRYATAPEQAAAKTRWRLVTEFANRHTQRAT